MAKEIEKTLGIPVVQIANLVPVAKTAGSNRVVPAQAIPYPMGDPTMTQEQQLELREHIVHTALMGLVETIESPVVFEV